MSVTRQTALERIRSYSLTATPHLVEQGFIHTGQFEVGAPFHHREIDFWAAATDRQAVAELFDELGALRLSTIRRPVWLNHDVYLLECSDGSLLVDVKFGDLKVGALTLLSESELLWSLDEDNRIGGAAQIADLLLRRLARGKAVDSTRLESVRSVWQELSGVAREAALSGYRRRFGKAAANDIRDLLEGRAPARSLSQSLQMQVFGAYFSSLAAFRMAAAKAFAVALARITRRPRPYGRFQHGTLTVVSGTEGPGGSTTLDGVAAYLFEHGLRCKTFHLGHKHASGGLEQGVYRVPWLNKAASWWSAVEYAIRTLGPRFYARVLGYGVLCDRYCYDIAQIPGGSTWALRFSRWLCPTPDANVVLYAPPDVILESKAERDREAIERQQTVLAEVVEGAYARHASLQIDTSKSDTSATSQQIARLSLELSHRDFV